MTNELTIYVGCTWSVKSRRDTCKCIGLPKLAIRIARQIKMGRNSVKRCRWLNACVLTPFLLPVLHQSRRGESACVHPRRFPLYEVLLAGSPAPLLHIPFINDFPFPPLLLVDDSRARCRTPVLFFIHKLYLVVLACVFRKNCLRRS